MTGKAAKKARAVGKSPALAAPYGEAAAKMAAGTRVELAGAGGGGTTTDDYADRIRRGLENMQLAQPRAQSLGARFADWLWGCVKALLRWACVAFCFTAWPFYAGVCGAVIMVTAVKVVPMLEALYAELAR